MATTLPNKPVLPTKPDVFGSGRCTAAFYQECSQLNASR